MLASTTQSEEMYLINVAMAGERGLEGEVPVRVLADGLAVSPISANQMVKKLVARGFVEYAPYHGVQLTESGWEVASRVLRHRRLWATFLVSQLGFTESEADEIACDLEHVTSAQVAGRLAALLGDPEFGPGGWPIPPESGHQPLPGAQPLGACLVGAEVRVVGTGGGGVAEFLAGSGIVEGAHLTVEAVGPIGDMLVRTQKGLTHLGVEIVQQVSGTAVNL